MDWKGLGYAVSIVSVFVLGAVAWPKPEDPGWVMPTLIVGVTTSIVGMAFRYIAHLQQRREVLGKKRRTHATFSFELGLFSPLRKPPRQ